MNTPPLLGFCARSGTGKTTLLTKLLPLLKAQGLRIGMIKHAHHQFDIDYPSKDSYELRKAGAQEMLVVSRTRLALVRETPEAQAEPTLPELLKRLSLDELDLVLVEGFKWGDFPKIELHRPSLGQSLLHPEVPGVLAIATDEPLANSPALPQLNLNAPEAIADFVVQHFKLSVLIVPAKNKSPHS